MRQKGVQVEEYAQACEYMGPVRQIDLMAAMAEFVAVFEKQMGNWKGVEMEE